MAYYLKMEMLSGYNPSYTQFSELEFFNNIDNVNNKVSISNLSVVSGTNAYSGAQGWNKSINDNLSDLVSLTGGGYPKYLIYKSLQPFNRIKFHSDPQLVYGVKDVEYYILESQTDPTRNDVNWKKVVTNSYPTGNFVREHDLTPPKLLKTIKARYIKIALYEATDHWNNGGYISIVECQVLSSTDVNYALGKTATSSSNANGYPVSKIVDDDTNSQSGSNLWLTAPGTGCTGLNGNQWAMIDLGALYSDIDRIRLYVYYGYGYVPPKDYKILYSEDGSTWKEFVYVKDQPPGVERTTTNFTLSINSDKFLLKKDNNYYTLKDTSYYDNVNHVFVPLTLSGGSAPNESDIDNFGFDNPLLMISTMTKGSDSFVPATKLQNFDIEYFAK